MAGWGDGRIVEGVDCDCGILCCGGGLFLFLDVRGAYVCTGRWRNLLEGWKMIKLYTCDDRGNKIDFIGEFLESSKKEEHEDMFPHEKKRESFEGEDAGFFYCPKIPLMVTDSEIVLDKKLSWRQRLDYFFRGRIVVRKWTTTQKGVETHGPSYVASAW